MRINRLFDVGKLRHRVSLYAVTRNEDSRGGFERQDPSPLTKIDDYWANIQPVSAKEREWGEQFTEVTTHRCWLRYNNRVAPGMVLRFRNIDHYIESVYDPNNLQEFLFLTLREGGPM